MEEEKVPQKVFEDLTKEERKLLQNEFSKSVETRYKVSRWSGIALVLPMLISGGFAMYYMVNTLFTNVLEFQFFICSIVFTLSGLGTLFLTAQYSKKFRKWLRECKNISTRSPF